MPNTTLPQQSMKNTTIHEKKWRLCDDSRNHTAGAAVEPLFVARDPRLFAGSNRFRRLFHAAFRHHHPQQQAPLELAAAAPTGGYVRSFLSATALPDTR